MQYLVTNPLREYVIGVFETHADATKYALSENRKDPEHPSMRLFAVHGKKARYVGSLWREFGSHFDPSNCWRAL